VSHATDAARAEPRWRWCSCTVDKLRAERAVCGGCHKPLAYGERGDLIHYNGGHMHTSCALDLLPAPIDYTPHYGAGFHP
jgi:hypothetical protein